MPAPDGPEDPQTTTSLPDDVAREDAPGATTVPQAAEQQARRLVADVAAYEVDPPPPARVREEEGQPEGTG